MDNNTHLRFDRFRSRGEVPPELAEALPAGSALLDQDRVGTLRNWRKAPRWDGVDGVEVSGVLDDAVWVGGRDADSPVLSPVDYKTRGDVPEVSSVPEHYRRQLDIYRLVLEEYLEDEAAEVGDVGYLVVYADPEFTVDEEAEVGTDPNSQTVDFTAETVAVDLRRDRAIELLEEASEVLASSSPPAPAADCPHCEWVDVVSATGNGGER